MVLLFARLPRYHLSAAGTNRQGFELKSAQSASTSGSKTVEGHVRSIFTRLGVGEPADDHRRVLAVLNYLRSAPQQV
jgi:hypothetical protein